MSAYAFVIGMLMIILLSLLWIPLNEVIGQPGGLGEVVNDITDDSDVIAKNNQVVSIFYYSLFIFIIVIAMWILKSGSTPREGYYQ